MSDNDRYADARIQIRRFLDEVHRYKRIHSALGYASAEQFERTFTRTHRADLSP